MVEETTTVRWCPGELAWRCFMKGREGKGKGERREDLLTSQLTIHYPQDMVNMDNKNATSRDSCLP